MTRAVQINLKQRINSAYNNEQMVISSKWIYRISLSTRTSFSAKVTRVSNFVEENVCVFFTSQGPVPVDSVTHQVKYANRNALSTFKH